MVRDLEPESAVKPDKPLPYLGTHVVRGKLNMESDGADINDNIYVIDGVNAALTINSQALMVEKIKLAAPLGKQNKVDYETLINDNKNIERDWKLTINNETKTT